LFDVASIFYIASPRCLSIESSQILNDHLTVVMLTFIVLAHRTWCGHLKIRNLRTMSGALRPFKCFLHLRRRIELQSHLLTAYEIMVCGQINAPANLPNHVHMYFWNSSFPAFLLSKTHVGYANATEAFHSVLKLR
jgi:hypothetical protein